MTVTKVTEFLTLVENTLGWLPDEDKPRWRVIGREAAKLRRKIATDPALYTWAHLELAVELLRREQAVITSPIGVFLHVPRALAAAHQHVTGDLTGRVHQAVTEAFMAGEPDWVERLSRATGDARTDVLAQWKAYRGE